MNLTVSVYSHNHSAKKKNVIRRCIKKIFGNTLVFSLNIAFVLIVLQTVVNVSSAAANPAADTAECGKRWKEPTGRIFGGTQAKFADWPWMSLLMGETPDGMYYTSLCGATLLNKYWVVTAAHCVLNRTASQFMVRLGAYNLLNKKERLNYEDMDVRRVIMHPQYNRTLKRNDIALLRLNKAVIFHRNILPICLPEDNKIYTGETVIAAGWGATKHKGPPKAILRQVELPVLANAKCAKMYRKIGIRRYFPFTNVCAGKQIGTIDACEGDSGGPLMYHSKLEDKYVLVGITSWGVGCGWPNRPGVYTRVSAFRDWIDQIIWKH